MLWYKEFKNFCIGTRKNYQITVGIDFRIRKLTGGKIFIFEIDLFRKGLFVTYEYKKK